MASFGGHVYFYVLMEIINTPRQLLFSLALRGDPAAFHTLFEDQIGQGYRLLLEQKQNSEEALAALGSFLRKTYSNFMENPPSDSPETWYAIRWEKHFGEGAIIAKERSDETGSNSQSSPPYDSIHLEIHRAHTEWSRSRKQGRRHHGNAIGRSHRKSLRALLVIGLPVLIGGYVLLTFSGMVPSLSVFADYNSRDTGVRQKESGTSRQISPEPEDSTGHKGMREDSVAAEKHATQKNTPPKKHKEVSRSTAPNRKTRKTQSTTLAAKESKRSSPT
ncbi:MAG: hypothetical protein GF344_17870, partial [Chitinivibrionales bacterium]|nr:hypothetical protein [Chitinivibrionales bacterium]MBD3358533.1 hypothetical protein [Chitinivibrionales bacterium]